jgi:nitroimidazol reductase NimA-like FMN-containing flavoprotein (pyridoxamine 5'-phosphate oxidase superfamily)
MTTDPSIVGCAPSKLVRVRRKPDRARYDIAAVHAVLDAAPFSHVATVRHGRPVVLPMAHGRLGGSLVLHGSHAAGLFRDAAAGSPVCITATLFDGLVLGRSARNHSMNYRSVTIHGHATAITEPDEIIAGLRAVVEHLLPGRWERIRKPSSAEIRETALWQVPIAEASAKTRSGSTLDSDLDRGLPVWAGHIPAGLVFGQPIAADGIPPGTEPPAVQAIITQVVHLALSGAHHGDVRRGEVVAGAQHGVAGPVGECVREAVAEIEPGRMPPLAVSPPAAHRTVGQVRVDGHDVHLRVTKEPIDNVLPGRP